MATTLDRRKLLRLGLAGAGAALGCGRGDRDPASPASEAAVPVRRRPLGTTGLEVSEIAFGAHGVDNPGLMAAALEAGITTFCTSGGYLDGREEEALANALARLGTPRDDVVLITGDEVRPGDTVAGVLGAIDNSLRRLRTDHLDVYYNAMVRTPADVTHAPLLEAFERARGAGKVAHLGLSGHHGGLVDCMEAALTVPAYDVFFVKYDFASYPEQDEVLQRAAARGVGTLVFKTTAGNRQHEIHDLETGGVTFRQATIRWALTNPAVASVAVTLSSYDAIRECAAAVAGRLTRHDMAMLERYATVMHDRYCRFCGHCEASCPRDVPVAEIMRYEMYFTCYGRESEALRSYAGLEAGRTAADCAACGGQCDGACPFGRRVRAGLVAAHGRLAWRA